MSKCVDWGISYGDGDIVCTCDNCLAEQKFRFERNEVDYGKVQARLKSMGWYSKKYREIWRDFCCQTCLREYESKHIK